MLGPPASARTLADYRPQHDKYCAWHKCVALVSSLKLPCEIGSWDMHVAMQIHHKFENGDCDCGLTALLTKERDQ